MILVGLLVSLVVGLVPTAGYAGFVYWLDQHEKEPWWLLLLVFLWGAIPAAGMAIIAQILLDLPSTWVLGSSSLAYELVGSSVWAPVTEEIAKGLGVVLVILLFRREVDSVLDGLVYGAMAGLGFALTENVLYFVTTVAESGWGNWVAVVLLRTVPFGLNHALFTGMVGAGMAATQKGRAPWVRRYGLVAGLGAGMVFHSIHNMGASLSGDTCAPLCGSLVFDWGGLVLLGVLVALVWRQETAWIRAHLPGEVDEELLQVLTRWSRWQAERWTSLLRGDLTSWRRWRKLRQTTAELAFRKEKLAHQGPDPLTEKEIEGYRKQLSQMLPEEGGLVMHRRSD